MSEREQLKGWYFAAADRKLRYNDNRIAAVGVTHTVEGDPKCCKRGLHASKRALDALRLGAGPVAFRVTLGGMIDHADNKSAAQTRTYDAGGIDCTNTLIEFACCAAMGAMLLTGHDDPRSWAAIEAALAWTRGEITRDELRSADTAAHAAYAAAYAGTAAAAVAARAVYAAAHAAYAAAYADTAANAAHAAASRAVYAADTAAEAADAADAAADAVYVASDAAARVELNALLEQMLDEAMQEPRT